MSASSIQRTIRVKELQRLTGWSMSSIYRLVHHPDPCERIPHARYAGQIHFVEADVRAWQERKKRDAEAEARALEERLSRRQRTETYEEECERLGVEPHPDFATD